MNTLGQRGQSSLGVRTLAVKSQMAGVVGFGARRAPIQHSALLLSVKVATGSGDQTGSWGHTRFFPPRLPQPLPLGEHSLLSWNQGPHL